MRRTSELLIERVTPEMEAEARAASCEPKRGIAGFFSGRTPSLAECDRVVANGFLEHIVARDSTSGSPLSFVGVFNADLRNQSAELAVTLASGVGRGHRLALGGIGVAVSAVLEEWPFRYLRARCLDETIGAFRSLLGSAFEIAVSVPDLVLVDGAYQAEHRLLIDASRWTEATGALLRRAVGSVEPHERYVRTEGSP